MAVKAELRFDGLVEFRRRVRGMRERSRDLSGAMHVRADEIQGLMFDEFREGRGPEKRPWKPLAPSTLSQGPRVGGPLVKTGKMRDAVFASAYEYGVVFGVATAYARYHQLGRGVPRRPFLPYDQNRKFVRTGPFAEWRQKTQDAIRRWVFAGEVR